MRTLTPEAEEFFIDQWGQYVEYLESEHGITAPWEYLEHVGKLDDFDDVEGLKSYLEKRGIPVDVFYQIAPMLGQDVMYASLNPGMQDNLSRSVFENRHEYGRKVPSIGDPEELAWVVAANHRGYLTSSSRPGIELIAQSMRDNLDPVSNDMPYPEYVDVNSRDELEDKYHGEIYLSRVFKYPSPGKPDLANSDLKFGRKTFAEEIEFVDPKLLVCGCRDAWMTVYRELVEDPQDEIDEHNGSTVSSKYGGSSNSGRDGAFYVPEYDLWIVTVAHEGRRGFIDKDGLIDNLRYVNEQISWVS